MLLIFTVKDKPWEVSSKLLAPDEGSLEHHGIKALSFYVIEEDRQLRHLASYPRYSLWLPTELLAVITFIAASEGHFWGALALCGLALFAVAFLLRRVPRIADRSLRPHTRNTPVGAVVGAMRVRDRFGEDALRLADRWKEFQVLHGFPQEQKAPSR